MDIYLGIALGCFCVILLLISLRSDRAVIEAQQRRIKQQTMLIQQLYEQLDKAKV